MTTSTPPVQDVPPRSARSRRDRVRTARAKAASRARRALLGLLMKLPGGDAGPESLLARFPDEALLPLRRRGLDPVPELGAVRDREPVTRLKMPLGLRGWLVTGYEESRAVLAADPQTFSNDFGHMIGKVGIAAEDDPGGLGFADPPAHTRLRKMLTPHFTARALTARAPRIGEIIDDALDGLAAAAGNGPVDLQQLVSLPIPSRTIMELIGVDEDARDEFQRLSAARFDFSGGQVGNFDPILEAIELLKVIVARQRSAPGPGLIGQILTEYGDDVGDVELAGLMDGVLTGGLETTVSMLSLGAVALLRDPSLAAAVRDGDETTVDAFVEELLRYLTVVQVGFPRFAVRDVTLAGKELFAGDVVLPSLSAANRDRRLGERMDAIDVTRPAASGHLAFGHGLHRCVGAELARVELRMAYPALLRRFPELRLAVPESQLAYRELSFVYGVDALPVLLR